jgi:PAS domain S-box-containing protein
VGLPVGEIEGRASVDIYPKEAAALYEADLEVIRTGLPKLGIIESIPGPEGRQIWVQTDKVPHCDETGKVVGILVMATDITERKRVEMELEKANQELIEASRMTGKAEVAASLLHNVGNSLNSVNVSASLVLDSIRSSRAGHLAKLVALMREHQAELGAYLASDPKGRHIPAMLEQLSRDWLGEQQVQRKELESLNADIDHIKAIVAMQQHHAVAPDRIERIRLAELVEDCLRAEQAYLTGQQIQVTREFEDVPEVWLDKQKLRQILINLLSNATLACENEQRTGRGRITLRIATAGPCIRISVSDNGAGVAPENLTRVFAQGFGGRKDDFGLGLHSAALLAVDIGGSLSAQSDGNGTGASFTLELPRPSGASA